MSGEAMEQAEGVSPETALRTLTTSVQELSLAADAESVQRIVRTAARCLTGADGATFVLRDGDHCFYVDEDAIAPLWKGQRFPLEACISGWSMLNRQAVVIPDIYADERIPHDAYRPTFVKSLVMVPIRTLDPLGAIGMYWADHHRASEQEIGLARALADSTAVALEKVQTETALDHARVLSETDPLTGLANRRAWDQALADAVAVPGGPLCVVLLDLDHFKGFNDEHGHPAGDRLLREVAAAWREAVRDGDFLARIGGDEFAAILPACHLDQAHQVAERMRQAVPLGGSASIGLAGWNGGEDAAALIARADRALYDAKAGARDRVVLAA
jgi:diguanylate cyclase (GGDEF)-like protein